MGILLSELGKMLSSRANELDQASELVQNGTQQGPIRNWFPSKEINQLSYTPSNKRAGV